MEIVPTPKVAKQVIHLETSKIESNPFQPRRQFDSEALAELAASIQQNGLLQPVTVRQTVAGYELIAGERRLLACRMLHMDQIPAIVEQVNDEQSAVFALIENLQRRDLNYFEQAQGMQLLIQKWGITQEQLAKRLGKAQSTVANKLRLLSFGNALQDQMLSNGLTERHARALLKLPNETAIKDALLYIVKEKLNVGETERYIETILEQQQPKQPPPRPTKLFVIRDMRIFMNTITQAVSTMKLAGIEIHTEKDETDDYIYLNMKIPKKSVYRASHSA